MTTLKQNETAQRIINNNPSMKWDGRFGFHSNGVAVMTIYWDFDETKEEFKIKINVDGSTINIKN